MADDSSPIQFEDIPIGRSPPDGPGPADGPAAVSGLQGKNSNRWTSHAVRMTIPEGTSPTTMKNRILRVAAELRIPVTIRKVPGGLLFWRSTDEDIQQAKEVRDRLQTAQRGPRARPGGRRR